MNETQNEIIEKLHEVEVKYNVKVIFAIESGSRAWGFESPDSDYDCRFVYVREKDSYITTQKKRDVIEYELNDIFDVCGWDLIKTLSLVSKSNASILEWLTSNIIYIENLEAKKLISEFAKECLNPVALIYHYLNIQKYTIGGQENTIKAYFYGLRSVINAKYVLRYEKMPPISFFDTLSELEVDQDVVSEITKFHALKQTVEEKYIVTSDILDKYISEELVSLKAEVVNLKHQKSIDYDKCDQTLLKVIDIMWND